MNSKCFKNQYNKERKSVFDWVTDSTAVINKNTCSDFTPPFLNYIPGGTNRQGSIAIDIENDLRGTIRFNSKCANCKFPDSTPTIQIQNKPECQDSAKIIQSYKVSEKDLSNILR